MNRTYKRHQGDLPVHQTNAAAAGPDHQSLKDPVCGMTIELAKSIGPVVHNGKEHYFCSEGCRDKFEADPRQYVDRDGQSESDEGSQQPVSAPSGAKYTCPMHPEVQSDRPGPCPKCGMALEPIAIQEGEEDTTELDQMRRRLWVCTALSAPLLVYVMGTDFFPNSAMAHLISTRVSH